LTLTIASEALASTVEYVEPLDEFAPFTSLHLGDIVSVPDGRSLSVRVLVDLPPTPMPISSFVVLGELEMMLAASSSRGLVHAYAPVAYLPPAMSSARVLAEGAAAYWAPHLPAAGGAMGEVLYRVVSLRSQVAPIVLVYRGPELIVFVPAGEFSLAGLRALRMPRAAHDPAPVARFAAVVDPLNVPVTSPVSSPGRSDVPSRQSTTQYH
jgi:hypothetical protein